MAAVFSLSVLTPEKNLFTGDAAEIVFSTTLGRVGMMAGHSPMFAEVAEGIMEILAGDGWKIAAVGQGFGEIAYSKAEFFVDTAEWADEIDAARAKEALERATNRIRGGISRVEYLRTQAAMSRALARLKAVSSNMSHKKV
jgi:F-type H+-transporting ATPase subunit epsilon